MCMCVCVICMCGVRVDRGAMQIHKYTRWLGKFGTLSQFIGLLCECIYVCVDR